MSAIKNILAGGVVAAALVSAAPAAAQYYPGYGSPYGGNPVGQVINQVLGGGYNGYGANTSQAAIGQCVGAVQARLNSNGYAGGYGGYGSGYGGYNGYGNYGYNAYGGAGGIGRVLGISRVEQRSNGGLTVRGVANSGRSASYGYGYNAQGQVDLTFKCKTDYRGFVTDVDIERAQRNYGYNYTPYNTNTYDYSQYGYRRY